MSLLDIVPVEVPKEIMVKRKVNMIKRSTTNLENSIEAQYKAIFDSVWADSELTAQEIFDELGANSASFLLMSKAVQDLCVLVNPVYVVPQRPNAIVINADGTVTVGDAIENS